MTDQTAAEPWVDPDDAPPLDAAWFDGADVYRGTEVVRRERHNETGTARATDLPATTHTMKVAFD